MTSREVHRELRAIAREQAQALAEVAAEAADWPTTDDEGNEVAVAPGMFDQAIAQALASIALSLAFSRVGEE